MTRQVEDGIVIQATGPSPPYPKMTFEAFLAWDTQDKRFEWVDGEVIEMSPRSRDHESIASFLAALLRLYAESKQSGIVFGGGYLIHLVKRPSGRFPDVQFTLNERRELMTDSHLEGGCDLAVEIISPDSRTLDRRDKFNEYEQAGIREYWLIDPIKQKSDFYILKENGKYDFAKVGPDGIFHSHVLDGLYMKVEWFWMDPMPPLMSILREWKLV